MMIRVKRGVTHTVLVGCVATLVVMQVASAQSDSGAPARDDAPRMLDRPGASNTESRTLDRGDEIVAYRMSWGDPGDGAVNRRLAGIVATMGDTESARSIVEGAVLSESEAAGDVGGWRRLRSSPIIVRYLPEYDEFRVIHEEHDANLSPTADIGVEGAVKVAEDHLADLADRGVIDPRLYSDAVLQLGYKVVGAGSIEDEVDPGRVVEYRLTLRPRLDGFELLNAGIRMGILTSGELASVRAGGVTPWGDWEDGSLVSDIEDPVRVVRTSAEDLRERFLKEQSGNGEVDVAWDRIAYVMPDDASEAVVEPEWVVSFSTRTQVDDQTVVGRRQVLAYSLTRPNAEPKDLSPSAVTHDQTKVSRDEPRL